MGLAQPPAHYRPEGRGREGENETPGCRRDYLVGVGGSSMNQGQALLGFAFFMAFLTMVIFMVVSSLMGGGGLRRA